jgi:hypothetical protein
MAQAAVSGGHWACEERVSPLAMHYNENESGQTFINMALIDDNHFASLTESTGDCSQMQYCLQ